MRLSGQYTFSSTLVLDARARSHPLTLSAAASQRHFDVSTAGGNLTAMNVVFAEGSLSSGSGAAVRAGDGAHVRLLNVVFRNNRVISPGTTPQSGGAVSVVGAGHVYLRGCTFVNNTVVSSTGARGGALGISNARSVSTEPCRTCLGGSRNLDGF
jgi:hypothetical protein